MNHLRALLIAIMGVAMNSRCHSTEVLATGLASPGNLLLEGDVLYYGDGSNICKLSKQGGAITTLTNQWGGKFSIASDFLVGGQGGYDPLPFNIYRVQKTGGAIATVTAGSASGFTFMEVVGPNAYYMLGFYQLWRVPVAGGTAFRMSDCGFARATASDQNNIYYHEYNTQTIRKYNAATNTNSDLLINDGGDGFLFVDSTFVYFSRDGSIKRLPKAGGAATTVISGTGVEGWASNGTHVFYSQNGYLRCASVSSGISFTIANLNGRSLTSVTAEPNYVYWADTGSGDGRISRAPLDSSKGVVDIASSALSTSEGAGSVPIQLNRSSGSGAPASVTLTANPNTATSDDFVPQVESVVFGNGETARTIFIKILHDGIVEPNESFTITLSNPSSGLQLGAVTTAAVTIVDDNTDTDGDGMLDTWENLYGLNPLVNDRWLDKDGDDLANYLEWQLYSRPDRTDSDLNGIGDAQVYAQGLQFITADSDGDALPDAWEAANGLNPLVNDATGDADGDGLTNAQEYNGGVSSTNPRNRDSDGNGVSDYEQRNGEKFIAHRYDRLERLVSTTYDNGAWEGWRYDGNGNIRRHLLRTARDADNDGLADAWEFANGLSFTSSTGSQGFGGDADGDGWTNQQEFLADTAANDATSLPPAGTGPVLWANPPKSRIIFPPLSGGAWSQVKARLWDAEANNAQAALQWFDTALQQWRAATILKVNNGPASGLSSLATSPGGNTHDLLWNAIADLPAAFNGTILLRTTAQDAAGTTTSETVPYIVNTTGDFDADGIPDAWEIANNFNPNSATGPDGSTGDGDHDSLNNFGEYVFHLSTTTSDASNAFSTSTAINPADGKLYLTLTYRRRLDAAANGLTYQVQTSTNLIIWTANGSDVEAVSTTPSGDGITQLVTIRIKPPLVDAGAKKFVRVQVVK